MEFVDREGHGLNAYELPASDAVALGREASVDAGAAHGRAVVQLDCSPFAFAKLLRHDGRQAFNAGVVAAESQGSGAAVADTDILHGLASDRYAAEVDGGRAELEARSEYVEAAARGFRRKRVAAFAAEFHPRGEIEASRIVAELHLECHQASVAGRYSRERGVEDYYHIVAAVHVGRDAVAWRAAAVERHTPLDRLYAFGKGYAYLGGRDIGGVGLERHRYSGLAVRRSVAACHGHDISRVEGRQARPQRQHRDQ